MVLTSIVLAAATSGFVPPAEAVSHFPGDFFDTRVREPLQRSVMASWPGPTELVRLWREGDFTDQQRVALLVGSAAFHDPVLLPIYREAVASDAQILRKAAVYGYRDLIGERLPNVALPIDDEMVKPLQGEMRWVGRTLQRVPLIAMWLQSALVQEGASLPGYMGVKMTRSTADCFRAAGRIARPEDLDLLVTAYEMVDDLSSRVALVRLIEGVSLSRFIAIPTGPKKGWGLEVYENAFRKLDRSIQQWRVDGCVTDGEEVIRRNLRGLGVDVEEPFGPEACTAWMAVLDTEISRWWTLAARQLYDCGCPWYEISLQRPESKSSARARQQLRAWLAPFRFK